MGQSRTSQAHNLKRSALRASLWLARFLFVLPAFEKLAPASARRWLNERLDILAQFALNIIFIRAARSTRPPANIRDCFQAVRAAARHDVRICLRYSMRATLGGRLRRVLKGRSLKARAEAILRALQNQEKLAARLARRAGLSRRASAHTRVLDALAASIAPAACAAAGFAACEADLRADTS
jgi:hypothetical protein